MEQEKLSDSRETINHLQEEVRTLRLALETTDPGKTMLRQGEEFSRLLSVSKLIVSELDLDKVFNLVADSAREIVDAELVLVPMLNEGRDQYTYVAASGTDAEKARSTSLGAHVGLCGWVLRNKRSLLFGETSTHWMDGKTTWEAGQQSAVLVPLIGRVGIIGGLSALGKQGGGCFTQHDLDLLTVFANQVSIAIENAQLFRQVTREIEDRKRAEDELHVSRNMLRQILNTMPQSVFWKDRDCVYLGCNDVFARAVGLDDPNQIVGKTDFDLPWPKSEAEAYRADDQEVMTTNRPKHHFIEPLQKAGGTRLWIDTSKIPLVGRDGKVFGVLGVYDDITEKHLLAEEQLKTQKLESIGTLAGGIAHDFNNLLQGIFGYISMAKITHDQKEKSLAMLDQAEKALHQSVNLTTQLLTFSKGGKPVKKVVDLRRVIENSANFTLSGSRSDLEMDIAPDLWHVEADEGQIGQVIQNIVLNADQSMPMGGTVLITARNIPEGTPSIAPGLAAGNYVLVTVQDTGIGIPGQYTAKIFDPYFTTKEKGSGLGLATSYSIVRNHGGAITVTSVLGKGSTFSVYLPAVKAEIVIRKTPVMATTGRKGKILVMDDEELIRNIASELISALEHDVDLAEDGEAAIEKYQAAMESGRPFDVVILDLTVRGGMGGRETIKRLREIDPAVRAIVSSGYSDDAVVADYKKYGFSVRLTKPYTIETLRDALNALLSD